MSKVRADSVPKLLDSKEDIPQRRVVGKDLDLARTIEEHIILYQTRQNLVSINPTNSSTQTMIQFSPPIRKPKAIDIKYMKREPQALLNPNQKWSLEFFL